MLGTVHLLCNKISGRGGFNLKLHFNHCIFLKLFKLICNKMPQSTYPNLLCNKWTFPYNVFSTSHSGKRPVVLVRWFNVSRLNCRIVILENILCCGSLVVSSFETHSSVVVSQHFTCPVYFQQCSNHRFGFDIFFKRFELFWNIRSSGIFGLKIWQVALTRDPQKNKN